jgi:hypothetical protein
MGSTRSSSPVSQAQSDRIRSHLRGSLKGVKVKIPIAPQPVQPAVGSVAVKPKRIIS